MTDGIASRKGYLCVVVASVLWATSGTAGKALFEKGISPFELVQARVTLATAFLGPALFFVSRKLLVIRLVILAIVPLQVQKERDEMAPVMIRARKLAETA